MCSDLLDDLCFFCDGWNLILFNAIDVELSLTAVTLWLLVSIISFARMFIIRTPAQYSRVWALVLSLELSIAKHLGSPIIKLFLWITVLFWNGRIKLVMLLLRSTEYIITSLNFSEHTKLSYCLNHMLQ